MLRICKKCGREFEATPKQRYCENCRRTKSAERARELRECVCVQCGKTFWGRQGAKFCRACKNKRELEQRALAYQRKRSGKARTIGSTDICQMCGGEYIVNSGVQKFCPECSKKNHLEKNKQLNAAYYAKHKNRLSKIAYSNTLDSAICKWCGRAFTASRDNFTTCSPECAEKYKAFLNKKRHLTYTNNIEPAAWLIDARNAAGLTQKNLAQKIGVTKNAVSNWEQGYSRPSPENLMKLQKILAIKKEEDSKNGGS